MIFVSSLAFKNLSLTEACSICFNNNFNLEFTSSMDYSSDLDRIYQEFPLPKMTHNYFPPPKHPFVLNLASYDITIIQKSINHCKLNLLTAKKFNSPFYAAHAGFMVDPNPEDLGAQFDNLENLDVKGSMDLFIRSLIEIIEFAEFHNIDFLIENNVLIKSNYLYGISPLHCCSSAQIKYVFNKLNSPNFGLLLDTAHLKVSCNTLGLDLEDEFHSIRPFIKAIHHSDNDGFIDSNSKISKDYWFLKHLDSFNNCHHVLEISNLDVQDIKGTIQLFSEYGINS